LQGFHSGWKPAFQVPDTAAEAEDLGSSQLETGAWLAHGSHRIAAPVPSRRAPAGLPGSTLDDRSQTTVMSSYDAFATEPTISWLLTGDPSVRWQTHAHLLDAAPDTVIGEQAKVADEGWGAALLALQAPDGSWGGGLYNPKWTSTHYTLLALRRLGLPRENEQATKAARLLLEKGFRHDHGVAFHGDPAGRGEMCISGMCLSMFSYFLIDDERVHLLAAHVIEEQMADAGWNCQKPKGATHSSFHTTCSALEGLYDYLTANSQTPLAIEQAMVSGRRFLLDHRLFRSHTTGEVVSAAMTRFPFPPHWQYDVMRALDHFALSAATHDEGAADAIELVESKVGADGRWRQYRGASGEYHFAIERPGKPSRANTMRALRALKWWYG
jgi:hypothetical protein